ncbi:hypothetical protein [Nitratireductor basaltis]|uniref:hypothetical protein n=1 Tax=Nitratireductor basaltis TaxID=472175 RepID=UPI0013781CF5|nr:hypothetical protein [Nitratireductor basaltis]
MLFLIFNLAGIPILGLLMRPIFVVLYSSGEPGAARIALGIVYFLSLLGTNIGPAIWAWKTEPVRWVGRVIGAWAGISSVAALGLGAITPWGIVQTLVLLSMMRIS